MLYTIVLVSAIHQYESAIGKNMSLPSGPFLPSPTPSQPSRLSGSTGLSSLHHTNSHQRSILLIVMYMFPCYSLNLSCLLLPPLGPEVHSLCLQFHCCPANRFISTIFLDSIHVLIYSTCLFLTYFTLLGPRFIHLIRTDSNAFFLTVE